MFKTGDRFYAEKGPMRGHTGTIVSLIPHIGGPASGPVGYVVGWDIDPGPGWKSYPEDTTLMGLKDRVLSTWIRPLNALERIAEEI